MYIGSRLYRLPTTMVNIFIRAERSCDATDGVDQIGPSTSRALYCAGKPPRWLRQLRALGQGPGRANSGACIFIVKFVTTRE
jgi:hypothetical protein